MKIFVTGGTGFIGSYFVNEALAAGHDVVALQRTPNSQPCIPIKTTGTLNITKLQWLNKQLSEVTINDLVGCKALVHLAAVGVTPKKANWHECFEFNVIETIAIAQKAIAAGIQRIVVTGTYAEYGLSGLRFDPIPPNAPLEPTDPYAASKAAASVALSALCRAEKIELFYFRVFSVYGEGQYEQNFWPQLRRAALAGEDFPMTEGDQIRDFLPVKRAALHLLDAATTNVNKQSPIVRNLASGSPIALRDFAEHWWKEFGATGKLLLGALPQREGEVKRYVPLVDWL